MDSVRYVNLLQESCLPYIQACAENPVVFQQDNAPIHNSNVTKGWLNAHFPWHPDWPPYSPDLNPMENMWAILARKVYEDGKQYHSLDALQHAVQVAWDEVGEIIRHHLIDSLPKRIVDVIAGEGKAINV
jgi:hypothetical protein